MAATPSVAASNSPMPNDESALIPSIVRSREGASPAAGEYRNSRSYMHVGWLGQAADVTPPFSGSLGHTCEQ